MICNLLAIATMLIAGVFMALMDLNAHGKRGESPEDTWTYKWKTPLIESVKRPWYYLGLYKPQFIERFPYSSTALVWLTDAWHRHKKLFLLSYSTVIALRPEITPWGALDALILNAIMIAAFNVVYHWRQIFGKKKVQ